MPPCTHLLLLHECNQWNFWLYSCMVASQVGTHMMETQSGKSRRLDVHIAGPAPCSIKYSRASTITSACSNLSQHNKQTIGKDWTENGSLLHRRSLHRGRRWEPRSPARAETCGPTPTPTHTHHARWSTSCFKTYTFEKTTSFTFDCQRWPNLLFIF